MDTLKTKTEFSSELLVVLYKLKDAVARLCSTDIFSYDPQRKFTLAQKKTMLKDQDYKCRTVDEAICFGYIDLSNSEADHKTKYSDKGLTTLDNGQMLCIPCHKEKTRNS